jgi:hypothetical protein
MTVHALERPAVSGLRPLFLNTTNTRDWAARPPLRAELFLIAHDEVTGGRYVDKNRLETGLAAAILLELWLAEYVAIGWRYDARHGPWQKDPGRLTVLKDTPTGDPLIDSAVALLQRMSAPRIHDFIRAYTEGGGLYERVRGDMTATGLLRTSIRRRFFFHRAEVHVPAHPDFPVRARTKVRYLLTWPRRIDRDDRDTETGPYVFALTALVIALGLTSRLILSEAVLQRLREKLNDFMSALPDPTIRDVATAIAPRLRALAAPSP